MAKEAKMNKTFLYLSSLSILALLLAFVACGGAKKLDAKHYDYDFPWDPAYGDEFGRAIFLDKEIMYMVEGKLGTISAVAVNHPNGQKAKITMRASYANSEWARLSSYSDIGPFSKIKFRPIKPGLFPLVVSTDNHYAHSPPHAFCWVTVFPADPAVPTTGITLDQEAINIPMGGNYNNLVATIEPPNATQREIFWLSDNMDSVGVSTGSGIPRTHHIAELRARRPGTAIITARDAYGIEKTCRVTVPAPEGWVPVTNLLLDREFIVVQMGDYATLSAVVVPQDATDQAVHFSFPSSFFDEVAYHEYVSVDGLGPTTIAILPRSPGATTITVRSMDGSNIKKTIKVLVLP
jgi:hypothetical protein